VRLVCDGRWFQTSLGNKKSASFCHFLLFELKKKKRKKKKENNYYGVKKLLDLGGNTVCLASTMGYKTAGLHL